MKLYSIVFKVMVGTFLLWSGTTFSQTKHVVTGEVLSPFDGSPIAGAVISATGLSEPVETDSIGFFSFEVPALEGFVQAWAEGFYTGEQTLDKEGPFLFILIPKQKINYSDLLLLPGRHEAFGKKASKVTNISHKDFAVGALSLGQGIQNRIPGLQVVNQSGMPGEGYVFQARGIKSFVSNSSPLIVVNGMPLFPDYSESRVISGYTTDVLKLFSATDIKNVSFLQGAEASVFGSLGANGVLMIETEDASDLDTRVEYIAQFGVSQKAKHLPVLDREDYREYIGKMALTRYDDMAVVLQEFPYLKDDPDYFYNYLYNNSTDWQKEIARPAIIMDNNVRIKGGDAIAKYNLTFGFLDEQGVIDNTGFSRYSMKLNANINVSSRLQLYANMALAYYTNKLQEQGLQRETNPLMVSLFKSPLLHPFQKDFNNVVIPAYAPIRDAEGQISVNNAVTNPLALINQSSVESQAYDVLMNAGLKYQLTADWTLSGMVGLFQNYNRENVFFPGLTERTIMPLAGGLAENTVRLGIGETSNLFYNLNTSYKAAFNDAHRMVLTGGLQSAITRREYDSGSGRNTSSDFFRTLDNVSNIGRSFDGYIEEWVWMNIYANAAYYYSNLASVGVTAALDGSSSSGRDASRFGVFPSLNAAIYLKNTAFLSDLNWINRLDLRAEAVTTGNSNFSSSIGQYYYYNQVFRQLSGIVRANVPNTLLEWEKNHTLNAGLDLSVLNHRLDLSMDVYRGVSSDVIFGRQVSPVLGFPVIMDNVAEIQNQGVELGLQYYVLNRKDYHWVLGATVSKNENKLTSLGGEAPVINEFADGSALISQEGGPVYAFYGYEADGVYASDQEASQDGFTDFSGRPFQGGDIRFVNRNTDSVIDESDRTIIGDPNPDFFGSAYTSIRYKRVELSANFIYSYGNSAYNAVRRQGEAMTGFENQLSSVARAWSNVGQETDMPKPVYGDPIGNSRFSDRWVEDASFLKLKELTLSYDFDQSFLTFINGGQVYVSGENLLTVTDYLGSDPEFYYSSNPMMQGFDLGKVPHPRTLKLGFRLQF
jgi:TonB-linked SusC/RagA family outer membrane protein